MSSEWLSARLSAHEAFTAHVGKFVFDIDGEVEFEPGQYATLAMVEDGIERPYSICSAPGCGELEFYCDFAPEVMAPIARKMELGAEVVVKSSAEGKLVLDSGASRHLFLATVTGAGPFISMIRNAAAQEESKPMMLIHGCSVSAELGSYLTELRDLEQSHSWFTYVPTVSRPWLDPEWRGEKGRVEDVFRKHADRDGFAEKTTVAYACGNPDMIQKSKGILRRSGFPAPSIKDEEY